MPINACADVGPATPISPPMLVEEPLPPEVEPAPAWPPAVTPISPPPLSPTSPAEEAPPPPDDGTKPARAKANAKARAARRARDREMLKQVKAGKGGQATASRQPGLQGVTPPRAVLQPAWGKKGKVKGGGKGKKGGQNQPIPQDEWQRMGSFSGVMPDGSSRICRFFNSSLGCAKPGCEFAHVCMQCHRAHPLVNNH